MLLMPPRHGKPVWEEELIIMGDGTWKPLKEIKIGDFVMTHLGRPRKVTNIFVQGPQPCVEIKTKHARSVVAAKDHPFLTLDGWKKAGELVFGEVLAVPSKFYLQGSTKRTTDEFALAGYMLSDGGVSPIKGKEGCKFRVNFMFTNQDPDIQRDWAVCVEKQGFKYGALKNKPTEFRARKGSKPLTPSDYAIQADLVGTSHTKSIPEWVYQGTEHQIGRFLGAYFVCDGTISKYFPGTKGAKAEIYSVNPLLADGLQRLFTMIGVHSTRSLKKQNGFGTKPLHVVRISGQGNLAKMRDKCVMVGKKNQIFLDWGFKQSEFPAQYTSDFVVGVEEIGELPCRCLEVEEDHTFLVQGLVVHNSELASIRFPAWHLGRNPRHEVINVGYNIELPTKFSRKVREIMKDPIYAPIFPDTKIDPTVAGAEAWLTTAGGGFTAAGVGGGITGKGAHVLIIDDPIKNQEEADSIVTRETLWDWYQSTAYTRLAPGGGVLVVQTWWHDDDLAGRLQKNMKDNPSVDQFEVIKYPAIAEEYEYFNSNTAEILKEPEELKPADHLTLLRSRGEGLHLDRYPTEDLLRIKANLDPRIWSALYQQNPVPDEGMYFKMEYFKYTPALPPIANLRIYASWDLAIGEKTHNDYNVGVILLQDPSDTLYLADMERFKGDSYVIVERMLDLAERWMNKHQCSFTLGVEDSNIWKAIRPLFVKRCSERRIYPFVETMKPLTDKMARARPLQGRMQQGKLWIPENSSYRFMVQSELLRFPAGAHDDIVDSLAWAVQLSVGKAPPRPPEVKRLESWKDKLSSFGNDEGSHMAA